ncbi:hypothetical protein WICMUC_003873 [Wickerhamomyces mucosus]|uniref:C2H2-type domain-containing protein n=1 Tax=Wickerhamomyces mucosus TaxID=1378264 RepID=A0A9P8PKF1_9ASCO|nr:hypothetical protein WICMUC_003873 [Wickerhamomyces mucosus]
MAPIISTKGSDLSSFDSPMNNLVSSTSKKKVKGRTFQCTGFPECKMTFTRSEHLARHIRKHTGERPFECPHCSRKFSRLDNLRQHKQTVHAHEQVSIISVRQDQPESREQQNTQTQQQKLQNNGDLSDSSDDNKSELSSQNQEKPEVPLGSATLSQPPQFNSKHRPSPLSLLPPINKSLYEESRYKVLTPRSADSNHFTTFFQGINQKDKHFALSPTSPVSSFHQSSQYASPNLHFLNSRTTDALISPYNLSFNSNIRHSPSFPDSNNSTSYSLTSDSINSTTDDELETPTTSYFENISTPQKHHNFIPTSSQYLKNNTQVHNIQQGKKTWLNNVLNNTHTSNSSSSQASTLCPPTSTISHHLEPSRNSSSSLSGKLKIENLLNDTSRPNEDPSI